VGEEAQEVRDYGGAAQHAGGPGFSRFVVVVVFVHLVFTIDGIVVVVCVVVVVVHAVVVLDVFVGGGGDGR
jgi:hypothetical protein